MMKNVTRSVNRFTKLPDEDLRALYIVVKNQQLEKKASIAEASGEVAYDPNQPYYEQYKVDLDTFKAIFLHVTPWGAGPELGHILAERTFR